MRRGFFGRVLLAVGACCVASQAHSAEVPATDQHWGMLEQYCVKCHNAEDWAGGVAFLSTMTPEEIPEQADIWEYAVRKLRGRLMPPPGKPQPDAATVRSFVSWMENTLDTTPPPAIRILVEVALHPAQPQRVRQCGLGSAACLGRDQHRAAAGRSQ